MITITLVRILVDGQSRLVGRTVSDRWNLLNLDHALIEDCRNQCPLKRLRRSHKDTFKFVVVKGEAIAQPSPAERTMLGTAGVVALIRAFGRAVKLVA